MAVAAAVLGEAGEADLDRAVEAEALAVEKGELVGSHFVSPG